MTPKNYLLLQKRLDKSPQGAPESEALFKILEILFSEEEALLASKLPIRTFSPEKAARIWKKDLKEAEAVLDKLADKGILFDFKKDGESAYIMAPTMAGFFEFSLMRTDGKFDTKVLSELYYQYINQEDQFLLQVLNIDPAIARPFVHEDMVEKGLLILDYEKASQVVETSDYFAVGRCYCRHKMEHQGKACDMPQDVCMSFRNAARSLVKHGIAREITKDEARRLLEKCRDLGLVQIGDNIQDNVGWICNCCGCCCEALLAYKKLKAFDRIHTNFIAQIKGSCVGCGMCVKKCPVGAISLKDGKAEVDRSVCLGCGVCKRFCPNGSIALNRREKTIFVPKDSFERFVLEAINNNKFQNLMFDNYGLWTHDLLRRLFKVIFSLPAAKRILVKDQIQSQFLQKLIKVYNKFDRQNGGNDYSHPELK